MNFYETEKINWLINILHERYGHIFTLQFNSNKFLTLCLPNNKRAITFTTDSATFSRADSNIPLTYWDCGLEGWMSVLGSPLPAPGVFSMPSPLVTRSDKGMHINYDILGLTYWMLSRQEEVGRTDLDVHGRFPATSSHAYKNGYLERPVVDEWLHILGQVIQRTWPEIKLKQHFFITKISHDVDEPSQYAFKSWTQIARSMGMYMLKHRNVHSFIMAPYIKLASANKLHQRDPFNTFEWIMDQSDRHGLLSAFYFICGHSDDHDADYLLEDPRIRYLMRRIHERGHEIGLHPSYSSYKELKMIKFEADRLRRICAHEGIDQKEWGGRMHYLRWEHPMTLQALCEAGMNYDSTLGYADHPGFRCGTSFEYPAFNPVTKKILSLRMRPLVVMECTLFDHTYLGLGVSQAALERALKLKAICKKMNGIFSLLWHNSNLVTHEQRRLYQYLIAK